MKATNGPLLVIVCGTCRNAQRIHELVNEMIDITHRARARDPGTDRRITLKKLKTILLQGGGYEGKKNNFYHYMRSGNKINIFNVRRNHSVNLFNSAYIISLLSRYYIN